jgi:hypothetical protein
MPPPRLVNVGGHIRSSTRSALRRNHFSAFSLHREDVQRRNYPLANHPDRNLKFNASEKRKLPAAEKKVPDDEWELRVGKLISAFDQPTKRLRPLRSLGVGRGIYVLTGTLPNFFENGLVINPSFDNHSTQEDSIYSKMIELSYTPPAALPSPLPQTLRIQGNEAMTVWWSLPEL